MQEIKEYASIFKNTFKYERDTLNINSSIDRLNLIIFKLDHSSIIPYILYIIKNVDDENTREEIYALIESYIMRRMMVRTDNKSYSQIFLKLIKYKIVTKDALTQFLINQDGSATYMPQDEKLKEAFKNPKPKTNKQFKGILYLLESKIRVNEKHHSTELMGIENYSVEHLMPKEWKNNWPKLTTKEEEIVRNKKLQGIGNLALITKSLNSAIGNSSWDNKRKELRQYAQGLETIREALEKEVWNEQEIDNRAIFLYNHARKIWEWNGKK